MVDIKCQFVAVCSTYEDIDPSVLEETIDNIRGVIPPDEFPYRDVVIEEDIEEYDALYSSADLDTPSYPIGHSVVEANSTGDTGFHVHSYLERENFEAGLSFHEELVSSDQDDIRLNYITPTFHVDSDFEELVDRFSTVDPDSEDLALYRISFSLEDREVQFSSRPEESTISVPHTEPDHIAPNTIQETVMSQIEDTEQYLRGMVE